MESIKRWTQVAEEFGISETELKSMSFREDITDEDGKMHKKAIDNGIFILINQGHATISSEIKRKRQMNAEFESFKHGAYVRKGICVLIKIVAMTSNEEEARAAVYTSIAF